jgi:ABC-type phosphate transport system permease subunit
MTVKVLIAKLMLYIVNPLIVLVFAIALLVFLWGIFEFVLNRDANSEKANAGKMHMLWGTVGMFIMISAFAIARLIATTIGSKVPVP